ncbi:MAG: FHA domain-containing protein [bacterium]|nr:FHA domain-containing protein [bacterium]
MSNPDDNDRSGTAAGGTTATGAGRTGVGKTKDQPPVVSSHAPRVRLSVVRGVGAGKGILLRRVASIIGSSSGVKMLLRHPDVSGLHCALVNTGGLVYVRDLQSRQGTFLNDLKAEHEVIQDGDVIKIRPWQLRVTILTPKVADTKDVTGLGLEPAPAAIALEDPSDGQVTKLPREINLLGRRHSCDCFIDDRSVSRAHALVFNYHSQPVVFDLMSHNGTRVNGKSVAFSPIKSDDVLSIGGVELRVRLIVSGAAVASDQQGDMVQPPQPDGTFSDRIDIRAAEVDRR